MTQTICLNANVTRGIAYMQMNTCENSYARAAKFSNIGLAVWEQESLLGPDVQFWKLHCVGHWESKEASWLLLVWAEEPNAANSGLKQVRLLRLWLVCVCTCVCGLLCLTLFHPIDCSPSGSFVLGIFWARILEWVAISSSGATSQPRDRTCISCIGRDSLPLSHLERPVLQIALLLGSDVMFVEQTNNSYL